MSGGGSKGGKDPLGDARKKLGDRTEKLVRLGDAPSFASLSPDQRVQEAFNVFSGTGLNTALSSRVARSGGFVPFNADDRAGQRAIRGLSGFDPALGQAQGLFQNNAGVNALKGINIGRESAQARNALNNFNSNSLRALNFGDLRNFRPDELQGLDFQDLEQGENAAFDQLQATSRGDFLDVGNNPFLEDAIANAQRLTTERFTQDVQPALASQFGGGFGLTGSASINAQRRAADELGRSLSDQATSTFADQFNRERGFQEGATQFLGDLDLRRATTLGQLESARAQGIDQFGFDRASQLGQLGLGRAQGIDANALARAQSLGDLGLGFTQAGIDRGTNLGSLQNQQAQGLLGVGTARRQQEIQRANALSQIGAQQRAQQQRQFEVAQNQFNAPFDQNAQRLGTISSILGSGGVIPQGQGGGGSAAAGILGGGLSGAGLGFALGGPVGAGIGAVGGGLLGGFF